MKKNTASSNSSIESALELMRNNKYPDANIILQKLYDDTSDIDACYYLGITFMQLQQYAGAIKCMQNVIAINKNHPMAYVCLAEIYSAKNNFKQATGYYKTAADLVSDKSMQANIFYKIALLYQQNRNNNDALKFYKKSLQIQPNNAAANYNQSAIYLENKSYAAAEKCLHQAIQIKPGYYLAINNLASLLADQERLIEAETCYRKALVLAPKSEEIKLNLGHVLQRQNKKLEALDFYQDVTQANPGNFLAWERSAILYDSLQKKDESLNCYKRCYDIDPTNEDVKFRLASSGKHNSLSVSTAPKEYVARVFDDFAEKFDSHLVDKLNYKTPSDMYSSVMKVLPKVSEKLNIMDLGCGTGLCGKIFSDVSNKMIGVDLSSKMIEKAKLLNCYDELIVDDILPQLKNHSLEFDLVLSADVFVYIGDLEEIFQASYESLKAGGLFSYSVEALFSDEDYLLAPTGRYTHSDKYLKNLAKSYKFTEQSSELVDIRIEKGEPVKGYVVVLAK